MGHHWDPDSERWIVTLSQPSKIIRDYGNQYPKDKLSVKPANLVLYTSDSHDPPTSAQHRYDICAGERRRLSASEILRRRQRRPTSAEVVLGRLLEEIRALQ